MNKNSISKLIKNPKILPHRDGVALALKKIGKDKNIVVLSADLEESTRVSEFKQSYPDRFIEVGVAEQNLAGVAAGLAQAGKIPIMTSFGVFSPGRNWDQIRVSICYSNLHVIMLSSHAGLSVGEDGATHQALEDIALMQVLPNMIVLAPADAFELEEAIISAVKARGPVYIRFHRQKLPIISRKNFPFKIGQGRVVIEGRDVTIFACGSEVFEALTAAFNLKKEGISAEVVNLPSIKPLDEKLVEVSASKTRAVVVAEEHQIIGGLGSRIAQILSQKNPLPIEFVAIQDSFGESGAPEELLKKYHMTSEDILTSAKKVIKRKV